MLIVASKETLTYTLFDCYIGKFTRFKLCLSLLVDENTVNTWMQCGVEAQKETVRLIDIGAHYLTLYLIFTLVRSLFSVVFDCYIFFAPSCPVFESWSARCLALCPFLWRGV